MAWPLSGAMITETWSKSKFRISWILHLLSLNSFWILFIHISMHFTCFHTACKWFISSTILCFFPISPSVVFPPDFTSHMQTLTHIHLQRATSLVCIFSWIYLLCCLPVASMVVFLNISHQYYYNSFIIGFLYLDSNFSGLSYTCLKLILIKS